MPRTSKQWHKTVLFEILHIYLTAGSANDRLLTCGMLCGSAGGRGRKSGGRCRAVARRARGRGGGAAGAPRRAGALRRGHVCRGRRAPGAGQASRRDWPVVNALLEQVCSNPSWCTRDGRVSDLGLGSCGWQASRGATVMYISRNCWGSAHAWSCIVVGCARMHPGCARQ